MILPRRAFIQIIISLDITLLYSVLHKCKFKCNIIGNFVWFPCPVKPSSTPPPLCPFHFPAITKHFPKNFRRCLFAKMPSMTKVRQGAWFFPSCLYNCADLHGLYTSPVLRKTRILCLCSDTKLIWHFLLVAKFQRFKSSTSLAQAFKVQ